jgi:hypothetical protein
MTADWLVAPDPGDPRGTDYLRVVIARRVDVDAVDVWALALQLGAGRDDADVHRHIGVRLANGWSLTDIEHTLRVLG